MKVTYLAHSGFVAEDGDIVKKDIRPLEAKLIKPAVFGDNIF